MTQPLRLTVLVDHWPALTETFVVNEVDDLAEPDVPDPSTVDLDHTQSADADLLTQAATYRRDRRAMQAAEIARLAKRRLIICGIVQDEGYFVEQVRPHVDGDRVQYLGSVEPAQRAEVL